MSKTGKKAMKEKGILREEYQQRCPSYFGFEMKCPMYSPNRCDDHIMSQCWDLVELTKYNEKPLTNGCYYELKR